MAQVARIVGSRKEFPGIAACGIDCCLCPMHHVWEGDGCPGCTAPASPGRTGRWCAIARCAVRERGYETCADCPELPCQRLQGIDESDSFVTHRKTLENLFAIRTAGMSSFLSQQDDRLAVLRQMLAGFDDGRSKSLFCLASALLPVQDLKDTVAMSRAQVNGAVVTDDRRSRALVLRTNLKEVAGSLGIDLRLRK